MESLTVGKYSVCVLGGEGTGARPLLWLPENDREGEEIRRLAPGDYALACVTGADWNRDFSPWPAAKAFKGGEDFSGGADEFLRQLTEEMLPAVSRTLPFEIAWHGLCGYSLAGLMAVYAMYRTGAFTRFASVSGSLWYDGFLDYTRAHPFAARVERVYLSLGDKEARTKNARLSSVARATQAFAQSLNGRCDAHFEYNEGGHFEPSAPRLAKAIAWLTRK